MDNPAVIFPVLIVAIIILWVGNKVFKYLNAESKPTQWSTYPNREEAIVSMVIIDKNQNPHVEVFRMDVKVSDIKNFHHEFRYEDAENWPVSENGCTHRKDGYEYYIFSTKKDTFS